MCQIHDYYLDYYLDYIKKKHLFSTTTFGTFYAKLQSFIFEYRTLVTVQEESSDVFNHSNILNECHSLPYIFFF